MQMANIANPLSQANLQTTILASLFATASQFGTAQASSRAMQNFTPMDATTNHRQLAQAKTQCQAMYNDPAIDQQWYLEDTSLGGANICAAQEAYGLGEGSHIAVIADGHLQANKAIHTDLMPAEHYLTRTINLNTDANTGHFADSIIGAKANNSLGIAGVAPQARLDKLDAFYYQLSNSFFGNDVLTVEDAIDYTLGLDIKNFGQADKPADVILALTGEGSVFKNGCSGSKNVTMNVASRLNSIVIVPLPEVRPLLSSGSFPWDCTQAIKVGAANQKGEFSQLNELRAGESVDILAPGEGLAGDTSEQGKLVGLTFDDKLAYAQGSTEASYILAGHAGLANSICPDITRDSYLWAIQSTAAPIVGGCPLEDATRCGSGRLDGKKSLDTMMRLNECGGDYAIADLEACNKTTGSYLTADCAIKPAEATPAPSTDTTSEDMMSGPGGANDGVGPTASNPEVNSSNTSIETKSNLKLILTIALSSAAGLGVCFAVAICALKCRSNSNQSNLNRQAQELANRA